jgi:hypothetical protein
MRLRLNENKMLRILEALQAMRRALPETGTPKKVLLGVW